MSISNESQHKAPEFTVNHWLNTEKPLRLKNLRGSVVLLDMWDYTCVNCLRTLPYVKEWHRRYAEKGLTVIGVHTPEFAFGRERTQVEGALQELDIHYPVLLDNDFKTWHAYDNQFWPAKYLIDKDGFIRYHTYGEGHYTELEVALQNLLREATPNVDLPPVMTPIRPEDYPETRCYRPTPDLRSGLRGGALGNPEGYANGIPMFYSLPDARNAGAFYVAGAWQAAREYLSYQGTHEGVICLPYEAAEVNAVLSPHPDTVERMLHPTTISVEIWQDDQPIYEEHRGDDLTDDGRLLVNRPRMYNLIRNPGFERHELTLRVKSAGFAVYAFSFIGAIQD